MNRQEEIIKAAKKDTIVYTERDRAMFLEGAQWADAHPDIDVRTMAAWRSGYQAAIEKAYEWLEQNAYHYCDDIDTLHESALIGDFRHAMKGGEK